MVNDGAAAGRGDSAADVVADWGELIARLTYVYGIDPDRWLMTIPSGIVRACAVMAPRLEAEASMRHATEIAVGSGTLGEKAKDAVNRWERDAVGDQAALHKRRVDPQQLRAAGFGVRRFQKPRKAS